MASDVQDPGGLSPARPGTGRDGALAAVTARARDLVPEAGVTR